MDDPKERDEECNKLVQDWHTYGAEFTVFVPQQQPAPTTWDPDAEEFDQKGRVNPHYLKHWKFFGQTKDFLRERYAKHKILRGPALIFDCLIRKFQRRIEALGLIPVLALMVWRLMERTMRISLKESNAKVVGWNNRQTSRPTSFMMTTKFVSAIVIRTAERRFLAEPLDPIQERYLSILGLSEAVFTDPFVSVRTHGESRMQTRRDTG